MLEHLADGEEVAQRLGHLLVIHPHRAGMHPGVNVRLAGGRLALGDLVLVMREGQIGPSAMDVKGLAQAAGRHRRALDVPARPPAPRVMATPPRRAWRPSRARSRGDPPCALPRRPGPRRACRRVAIVELAVIGELADPVIDVAIGRRVGVALSMSVWIMATISSTCRVARGSASGRSTPSRPRPRAWHRSCGR